MVTTRLVAGSSPVLHTRAPTGKVSGPAARLLLSRPITSHVMGVMDRIAAPWAGVNGRMPNMATTSAVTMNSNAARWEISFFMRHPELKK